MLRQTLHSFLIVGFLCVGLPSLAFAAPRLLSASLTPAKGGETMMFTFNQPVTQKKIFRLDSPYRLVLDLPILEPVRLAQPQGGKLVKSLRSGQFDSETTRIVMELNGPIASASASEAAGNKLIVTMSTSGSGGPVAVPVIALAPQVLPLIIIDAGHGGKDPGAAGDIIAQEKTVTLRYAKKLRDVLAATGRYRVALTRDDDRFILLGERVRIAQRAGGNVFISLHADTAPGHSAHGISVYTVSETASDAEAQRLADQENNVDVLAGFKVEVEDAEAASILIELAQRESKNKASAFAENLVGSFTTQGIAMLPSPHRFAGFRVLKAPDIPSVLIETGFLSSPKDERLLSSKDYAAKLSKGVVQALDSYFRRHPLKAAR